MRMLACCLLLASGLAQGADYSSLPGSTLGFTASFQGKAIEGQFKRFTPQIRFDAAHLAQSRFDVAIDLASAATGDGERDEALQGEDFFSTRKWAQARFTASKFRSLGGNRYAADGVLSLRGVSQPVSLAFTWSAGAKPVLVGDASLKRTAFGVGSGDWTDTSELADAVKVHTRLVLSPDGSVATDPGGKARGRGTYVCGEAACHEPHRLAEGVQRALGGLISPELLVFEAGHATA